MTNEEEKLNRALECLRLECPAPVVDNVKYIVAAAIDAARKDEAIAFNRWLDGQGWECGLHDDEDVKHWQKYGKGEILNDEQLYQLFKQQPCVNAKT